MLSVTEYEGDVGEGTVECDASESRTTLTIRPLGSRRYSEVQIKWASGGFTNLQLLAWDEREKPCADYVKGNDDRKTFDQLVAEYTGQPLQDWVTFVAEDNPDCKMPTFRKQIRIRKPRVKLPPAEVEVVAPAPAKKKRKIPKHIAQFTCYDCEEPTLASKAVPCDDGVDVCRICAGIRWAEAHEAERPPEPEEPKYTSADFRWFVLSCSPNQERKVRRALLRHAKDEHVDRFIKRVLIPTNKEIQVFAGSRVVRNKKTFSGYLVAQIVYTAEVDDFFRKPKVRRDGCWGPMPLTDSPIGLSREEIDLILLRSNKAKAMPRKIKLDFKKGQKVLVTKGEYEDAIANVVKINGPKHDPVVTIGMTLFSQPIEVEVPFDHCEKLTEEMANRLNKIR